ncbi:hypothetical protein KY290_037516 [Solanum tuberosum]|uniref:Retrotransposon Copia-like N-terminal domain-containing protein n=1 Tax=Solanum tuberosum TaxID=4113 RepID=A0ABQ7TXF1_SOLTU|nr:hypothetical protein KY290_037516 [Solanum tuberosum]
MVDVEDPIVNQPIPTPTTLIVGGPLYIYPSNSAGAVLVPVAFDGTGFSSWKRGVLRSLSVKNKLGFINGECLKPAPDSPDYRQWERCDAMEINDLSQGTLDITSYYTRMKKLWEELHTLSVKSQCNYLCNCGAKATMHQAEQERRLIQFLMGLNESGNVRTRPFCEYCKKLGHTKNKCYKLHGYPNKTNPGPNDDLRNSNYNGYKGKGIAANVHGELSESDSKESSDNTQTGQNGPLSTLSTKQYHHLVSMLPHFQGGNMKGAFPEPHSTSGAVNFAGATHHITFNKNHFTKLTTLPYPILVNLPNGYRVKVTQVGTVIFPLH